MEGCLTWSMKLVPGLGGAMDLMSEIRSKLDQADRVLREEELDRRIHELTKTVEFFRYDIELIVCYLLQAKTDPRPVTTLRDVNRLASRFGGFRFPELDCRPQSLGVPSAAIPEIANQKTGESSKGELSSDESYRDIAGDVVIPLIPDAAELATSGSQLDPGRIDLPRELITEWTQSTEGRSRIWGRIAAAIRENPLSACDLVIDLRSQGVTLFPILSDDTLSFRWPTPVDVEPQRIGWNYDPGLSDELRHTELTFASSSQSILPALRPPIEFSILRLPSPWM
jgi:hypothetical protein